MAVEVTGLNGNNYRINNDIVVTIKALDFSPFFFDFLLINRSSGISNSVRLQVPNTSSQNPSVTLNLSPYLKAMFIEPSDNENWVSNSSSRINNNEFTIRVIYNNETIYEARKNFIRSGYLTNERNLTIPSGKILTPCESIPYWIGYPVAQYTLLSSAFNLIAPTIEKNPNPTTWNYPKELKQARSCENTYVRFLNREGGYSYWLFESAKVNTSSTSIGTINNFMRNVNLGNEVDSIIEVYSRVQKRFIPLMEDLIYSPDISIFNQQTNQFEKAFSANNKIDFSPNKSIQEIKIKLTRFNNFKPQITW